MLKTKLLNLFLSGVLWWSNAFYCKLALSSHLPAPPFSEWNLELTDLITSCWQESPGFPRAWEGPVQEAHKVLPAQGLVRYSRSLSQAAYYRSVAPEPGPPGHSHPQYRVLCKAPRGRKQREVRVCALKRSKRQQGPKKAKCSHAKIYDCMHHPTFIVSTYWED